MKPEFNPDLAKEPFPVFFRQAMVRTPQGIVFLASVVVYAALAVLSCISLSLVGLPEGSLSTHLVLFLGWIMISFTVFITITSLINYRPSWIAAVIIAVINLWPLSWVYA